jgi:predicted nucleic acid-binding protein
MVLETAINGLADAIVTFNEKVFRSAAKRFDISVIRPAEVVRRMLERAK